MPGKKQKPDFKPETHELNGKSSEAKEALTEELLTTIPEPEALSSVEINTDHQETPNIDSSSNETASDQIGSENAVVTVSDETTKDSTGSQHIKQVFHNKFTRSNIIRVLRILCILGFVIFLGLFINETVIQPYRSKKDIDNTRDLYHRSEDGNMIASATVPILTPSPDTENAGVSPIPGTIVTEAPTPTPDPNRDEQGRLLQFTELLVENEDTKGWITIPDTDVDYVVVQPDKKDPEYYLFKGFNKEYSKAGTLFLDPRSSVETHSRNLVIHGHNMVSTKEKMFHSILEYKKDIEFYREHPILRFDTIYNTGIWKIFAVFITPPDPAKDYFFEYRKSSFQSSSEFLNFVYQIRIRSLINVDAIDINEKDELLMLSTCSYEVNDNYRTVLVARKVREGEEPTVDVNSAEMNQNPYYAEDYRRKYGKEIPDVADTFEEALDKGQIRWYTPAELNTNE